MVQKKIRKISSQGFWYLLAVNKVCLCFMKLWSRTAFDNSSIYICNATESKTKTNHNNEWNRTSKNVMHSPINRFKRIAHNDIVHSAHIHTLLGKNDSRKFFVCVFFFFAISVGERKPFNMKWPRLKATESKTCAMK